MAVAKGKCGSCSTELVDLGGAVEGCYSTHPPQKEDRDEMGWSRNGLYGHQVTCQPQEKFCAMRQNHNPQTRGMPLLGVSLASEACVLAKAVNVPVSLPWVLLRVLRAWP